MSKIKDFGELKEKLDYNEIPYEEGYDEKEERDCLYYPDKNHPQYTAFDNGNLDIAYADIIGKFFGGQQELLKALAVSHMMGGLLGFHIAGEDTPKDIKNILDKLKDSIEDDPDNPNKIYWDDDD